MTILRTSMASNSLRIGLNLEFLSVPLPSPAFSFFVIADFHVLVTTIVEYCCDLLFGTYLMFEWQMGLFLSFCFTIHLKRGMCTRSLNMLLFFFLKILLLHGSANDLGPGWACTLYSMMGDCFPHSDPLTCKNGAFALPQWPKIYFL